MKLRVPKIYDHAPRPVRAGRLQLKCLSGTGWSITCFMLYKMQALVAGSRSRTSPSSRRGRNPLRSTWTRCWSRCRKHGNT